MSESKVSRAQNLFNKATREYGISEGGRRWLIEAIDPYHDIDVDPCGFPDTNVSGSVIQVVKSSMSIQKPTGVTGNWDCNVFNLPHVAVNEYCGIGQNAPCQYDPVDGAIRVGNQSDVGYTLVAGGVTAVYGDPTAAPFVSNGLTLTSMACHQGGSTSTGCKSIPLEGDSYFGGNARVVAMGFEVVNTTAEINLQGVVAAYRQPLSHDSKTTVEIIPSSGTDRGRAHAELLYDVPGDMSAVMRLMGTRQWKAKDGGYCTCTLNSVDNPSGPMLPRAYFLAVDEYAVTGSTDGAASIIWSDASFASFRVTDAPRFNTSGLYFSGLSNETTLTVNAIYYVERFPSVRNAQLCVLASPSVGYDSVAFEMYSRCLSHMPPGVPQWENGLGDWFKDVIAGIPKIARAVAPALGMLPIPGAGVASGIASAIGSIGAPGKTYSPTGKFASSPTRAKGALNLSRLDKAVEAMAGKKLTAKQKAALHKTLTG